MSQTTFPADDLAKIRGGGEPIDLATVERSLTERAGERIYGLHTRGIYAGQISRVPSVAYLDHVSTVAGASDLAPRDSIGHFWISRTTVADLVRPARPL